MRSGENNQMISRPSTRYPFANIRRIGRRNLENAREHVNSSNLQPYTEVRAETFTHFCAPSHVSPRFQSSVSASALEAGLGVPRENNDISYSDSHARGGGD